MTSFKDALAKKRKGPAAIFHKFRVDSSIKSRRHVFVEGYDDIGFYSRHIVNESDEGPIFHLCFGKKNLDEVAKLYWGSGIEDALALFIRDGDFDVFLGTVPVGKNLFVTCGYSVENYVCSTEALDFYLRSILCLDEDEVNIDEVVSRYVTLAEEFHTWLSPFYGAVMFAKDQGKDVDLNKLKVSEHFRKFLSGDEIAHPKLISELNTIGLVHEDFNEHSEKLGKEFSKNPALSWLRGKYLLTLLTLYLISKDKDFRDLQKQGDLSRFNRKAAASINEPAVFEKFSAFAQPSARLAAALGNHGGSSVADAANE